MSAVLAIFQVVGGVEKVNARNFAFALRWSAAFVIQFPQLASYCKMSSINKLHSVTTALLYCLSLSLSWIMFWHASILHFSDSDPNYAILPFVGIYVLPAAIGMVCACIQSQRKIEMDTLLLDTLLLLDIPLLPIHNLMHILHLAIQDDLVEMQSHASEN
ncbi:hypothetical protein POTOM_008412 [Populus tomentosa]|uniref:Uncharacterized protein n=1 Tax=Populus tomentosa TaxID=118781 RepID=A0A8X8AGZ0_POPTO|nr:hypothetical protein POTOM_008412 [Populus tomentosa]